MLADGLKKCCSCELKLDLSNIVNETRSGYGSWLDIKCLCGELNKVPTGKRHQTMKQGRHIFSVNTKVAGAIIHSGIGVHALERFMNAIEVPPASKTTIKAREREIGVHFESVADLSCKQCLESEITAEKMSTCNQTAEITASFDGGWQARGSSRNYNSKSGHAALIGSATGKVLNYAVRNRNCAQCEKDATKDHDCRLNWFGSSKPMEADIAVQLVNETQGLDYRIKVPNIYVFIVLFDVACNFGFPLAVRF